MNVLTKEWFCFNYHCHYIQLKLKFSFNSEKIYKNIRDFVKEKTNKYRIEMEQLECIHTNNLWLQRDLYLIHE